MDRLLLVLAALSVGCGGRAAHSLDLGAREQTRSDARPPPDRGPDAPCCPSVKKVAQISLELSDTLKRAPAISFDGAGFGLVWHSQPPQVSSLDGELRFARVDLAGTPSAPEGISLCSDNAILRPALSSSTGRYAVLHQPASGGVKGVELRQFDAAGKTLSLAQVEGPFTRAALAPHPLGHALLLAGGAMPQVLVVQDKAGVAPGPQPIVTAEVIDSVWLAPSPGGFAAGLRSSNGNGSLVLLGSGLAILKQAAIGHVAIEAPSFAVLSEGFASVYLAKGTVDSEVHDAAGEEVSHHELAKLALSPSGERQTATIWTGTRLIARYPEPSSVQYRAQVLERKGVPSGAPVPLPSCLTTASELAAAFGGGLLAVATVSEASNGGKRSVCVDLLACDH